MRRGRVEAGKRWVMALLTGLAAFVFPVRGPLLAPDLLPVAPASGSHSHSHHRDQAGAVAHADSSTPSPDRHPPDHQAHCLFCLTGAFALQADAAAPPAAPAVHTAPASPVAAQSRAAARRHADARAPPHRA